MSDVLVPFAEFEHQLRHGEAFQDTPQPVVEGQRIAWATKGYGGVTTGLSSVHRVAVTGDEARTFCGIVLPNPRNVVPALRSLDLCPVCANAFAKTRLAIVA